MSTEDFRAKFSEFVRSNLEPLAAAVCSSIDKIVSSSIPEDAVTVRFEIFADGFTQELPIHVYYLDVNETECGYCPFQPLAQTKGVYAADFDFFDQCENAGVDTYKTSSEICLAWFIDCWNASQGADLLRRAEIGIHDSLKTVVLKTRNS